MNYKDGIKQVFDEAFRQSNAGIDNQHLIVGTILTVDETLGLCSVQPIDQNTTIIDNVLISSADDAKPIFIPSIGTTVTVSLYDKESACVVGYGATTKVNLNAGEEDYGGLIKIEDLVDKINNLELVQDPIRLESFRNTAKSTPHEVHNYQKCFYFCLKQKVFVQNV